MKTSILIGGDTCPIGKNKHLFTCGNKKALLNDLLPEFENAGLSILNLECPLIQKKTPVKKSGPNLGAPAYCVNGLKAMGIDVVSLANNHIMDHGSKGLSATLCALDEFGIAHVGAGETIESARKILIREIQGVCVGILAVAEHEFGIASTNSCGANPLDVMDAVRNISDHRESFDHLIVLLHGGNEYYQYPSPRLMDTCHFLVEQGAGVVVCQHSHCVGCMETYRNAPIIYGQGNFLFDYPSKSTTWHDGILACLDLAEERTHFNVRLIPFRQSDGQAGIRRMNANEESAFIKDFTIRSESISDDSFVARQWEDYCQKNKRLFLYGIHGNPGVLRRLAGKFDLLNYLDSSEVQRKRLNFVRCESLREALITVLEREAERK